MNLKVVSTYETRNPKRTAKVSFNRPNPKPETRIPKPTAKVGSRRRNPKPETDSESWFQATKPETRNRQQKCSAVGFNRRNPKPETDSESWFQATKPETRNRKWVSIDETRNPKPTAKVGFNRRSPKPETDSESWFQSTKPETRNPKPTRIRLLGGSPDRNSSQSTMPVSFNHVHLWLITSPLCP